MTGMITMLKGREHEDEDDALKLITGTGKPVLILCQEQMDKDVSKRGQNWLAFWRQNYLAVTLSWEILAQNRGFCSIPQLYMLRNKRKSMHF